MPSVPTPRNTVITGKTTMRQIRKYANRKHYDESTSTYIQVLDIANLVAGGETVRVVCDVTGRDVTLETLSRALYERVKSRDHEATTTTLVPRDVEKLIRKVGGPILGDGGPT